MQAETRLTVLYEKAHQALCIRSVGRVQSQSWETGKHKAKDWWRGLSMRKGVMRKDQGCLLIEQNPGISSRSWPHAVLCVTLNCTAVKNYPDPPCEEEGPSV